jgi:hypothetical protein
MLPSLRNSALCFLAALVVFSLPAYAQFNASVQGTVTDPSGGVIPGASVTVTNQATLVGRTTRTSGSGFYNVTALPPGTYTVEVQAQGFETSTNRDVRVAAEQPRGLNLQLKTGATWSGHCLGRERIKNLNKGGHTPCSAHQMIAVLAHP